MFYLIVFVLFCVFVIINILTGFYLSKLITNIVKAIPLWIHDIWILDKKQFRGFGFWGFVGLGGSGKTISIVNYLCAIKEKYPHVKILTNFSCSVADASIQSWRDLIETKNINIYEITEEEYYKFKKWGRDVYIDVSDDLQLKFFYRRNDGVVFGFDEIHLTFESTSWEDAPDNLLDYISQQRKLHKQIVASSQVFTRINKKLREQTNFVIDCKSLLMRSRGN